ncbi:hypothetical protein Poli38472_007982 [Pythium oligandrum]|uniref:Uncharacterized protein n=1 Tax=Pythium oligandrum TaxID=41045 RepID=A0A8K1FIT2_PYTOL|nr:hypothetical protein Poli38472_007982 [Pythium oligandrum]|eukprot:TMW65340.1 hypothetical protein Poli38472_007982 [Pythium oligandrum]
MSRNEHPVSTAIPVAEDDDELENPVFHEKHTFDPNAEKDLQTTCIDGLLCCVRSRCLAATCVVFPCGLFLFVAWALPSAKSGMKLVFLILSAVPPGIYILSGMLLLILVCSRQISTDTKNATAAHQYLQSRANLKKIVVTGGKNTADVTVAGRFALFLNAAKDGNVHNFQWCLDNGQDVDEVDYLGRSALHWAAMAGTDEIITILLRNGASVDLRDNLDGLTPLHYAAYYGHVKITRVLVNAGANMAVQDNRKLNPLQLAEMASLKLASVQPSHQMITKFLRIAMKDTATPPLQHTTGLTVMNLVERQMMALPQAQ